MGAQAVKVKDLIKALTSANPEAEVIIQKDGEGNGYSPLFMIAKDGIYEPINGWSGRMYNIYWTAEEAGMEESEWAEKVKSDRCVILIPVN